MCNIIIKPFVHSGYEEYNCQGVHLWVLEGNSGSLAISYIVKTLDQDFAKLPGVAIQHEKSKETLNFCL